MSQHQILPDTLNDVSDFEEWFEKYELISKANEWDEETQINNVGIFLKDLPFEKLKLLNDEDKENYTALKSALKAKLFDKYSCEIAKSKFKLCQQYYDGESYEDFSLSLKKLCRAAYPDLDDDIRDMLCKDKFIDGIYNDDVRLWVRNFRPKTSDEASLLATVFQINFDKESEVKRNRDDETRREIDALRDEVYDLKNEIRTIAGKTVRAKNKKLGVCWCCGSSEHFLEDCLLNVNMLHVNGYAGFDKNVPMKISIDTGANVSLINEEIWKKTSCTLSKINGNELTLIGLNGNKVEATGKSTLSFYLNNIMFKFEFIVVKNLIIDCIIGSDFLKTMKCDISFNENVLKISNMSIKLNEDVKFDNTKEFKIGDLVFLRDKQDKTVFVVKAKLPNSTYRVQCTDNGKRLRLVVNAEQIVKA